MATLTAPSSAEAIVTRAGHSGRTMGVLLFVQLVGLILPFVLLVPATTSGFLEVAAGIADQIKVAVFLLFVNGIVTISISLSAFPFIRIHSEPLALGFIALSVIWFSAQAVDNVHILSMLSLSQQYAERGSANVDVLMTLATAVRASRRWAHYTELLVIDAWFFAFYGLLFRCSLVPRRLAALGIVMAAVHTMAIPLPVFLGYTGMPMLGVSLAVSHLAVASWLVLKGLRSDFAAAVLPQV
jgi:hypothetical protein